MATYNKFNCFCEDMLLEKHNGSTDTFKALLTNVAPVATNSVRTDITEINAGNGYTGLGLTLSTSLNRVGAVTTLTAADYTLNATGAIGPFRYIVIYNSTSATNALVCWFDYGASITLNAGETFVFDFDNTNGLFTIS